MRPLTSLTCWFTQNKVQGTVFAQLLVSRTMASVIANPKASKNKKWMVRPATPEDEEAVKELLETSYGTLLPQAYEEDVLEKALPLITTPRQELLVCGTWYVAEDPQTRTMVGCGGWTPEYPFYKDATAPHLRHFATDPSVQRCGVGKALWDQIRSSVSTTLGPDTSLEVISTLNAPAFYESLGFRVIRHLGLPLTDDCVFPTILMRRDGRSSQL
mmetsp:Transcript_3622/g.8062  ORF Transcript_3622/g.8062 Transcript_3622/m.8062 type:complete len:215 (-) Transcript_3622:674-1318(-)